MKCRLTHLNRNNKGVGKAVRVTSHHQLSVTEGTDKIGSKSEETSGLRATEAVPNMKQRIF